MKKFIYTTFLLLSLCFTACEKNPENGDLDGQWQLMEISLKEAPSDADYTFVKSCKEEKIYWRFQLDLLMIHSSVEPLNGYTFDTSARFIHQNNQLDITQTYIHMDTRGDSLITDPNTHILSGIGIDGNAEKFNVEKLNNKQMILSTNVKRLRFRKF